jgi:hypothetical protein
MWWNTQNADLMEQMPKKQINTSFSILRYAHSRFTSVACHTFTPGQETAVTIKFPHHHTTVIIILYFISHITAAAGTLFLHI